MTIPGKGIIKYIYDATGNKLEKETTDQLISPPKVTTTTYLGGYAYENNVLQFFGQEEGRIRKTGNDFVYDYFLKDHLGNVRMVLTDEHEQNTYPAATLEDVAVNIEDDYYDIKTGNIVDKKAIPSFANATNSIYENNNGNPPYNNNPNSNATANSDKLYRLNGANGDKTGLGITLKVMTGDEVNIWGKSYWHSNGTIPNNNYPVTNALLDLLSSFAGSSAVTGSTHGNGISGQVLNNNAITTGDLTPWLDNDHPTPASAPKAYINWILFDEHFKPVTGSNSSYFIPVGAPDEVNSHTGTASITKNGYLYVYCSNESNIDVFFDNLQVVHTKGPLKEETHYSPFGIPLAGICSHGANAADNKQRFNGEELQSGEFSDGSGLDWYGYEMRNYDPEIGRWHVPDPLADKVPELTPYRFGFNNPITYEDKFGLYEGCYEDEDGREHYNADVHNQKDLDDKGIGGHYDFEKGSGIDPDTGEKVVYNEDGTETKSGHDLPDVVVGGGRGSDFSSSDETHDDRSEDMEEHDQMGMGEEANEKTAEVFGVSTEILEKGFEQGEKLAETVGELGENASKMAGALGGVMKVGGVTAIVFEAVHSFEKINAGEGSFKDYGNLIVAGATAFAMLSGAGEAGVGVFSIGWGVYKTFWGD